jgi:hypothetical protein
MFSTAFKSALMLGAVGAGAVFATRSFLPALANMTVSAKGPNPAPTPIPGIFPSKDGYGAEWVLIPAAVGWYLTR